MAQTDIILPAEPTQDLPVVRTIGLADLKDALAMGLDDFRAMNRMRVPGPSFTRSRKGGAMRPTSRFRSLCRHPVRISHDI
jgi:hypothetical protein